MFITRRPKLIAYVAYAAVSLISRLAAQSSPAPPNQLPPLSQILDQHMRALGGERAVAASRPLLLKGTCDSTGVDENGPIEILVKSPNVVYTTSTTRKPANGLRRRIRLESGVCRESPAAQRAAVSRVGYGIRPRAGALVDRMVSPDGCYRGAPYR